MKNGYSSCIDKNINAGIKRTTSRNASRIVVFGSSILIFSVLFAQIKIFGSFSPFGMAFTLSLPSPYFYISLAGTLFGYIFNGDIQSNMPYIAALIFATAVRMLLLPRIRSSVRIVFFTLISFLGLLGSGIWFAVSGNLSVPAFILAFSEALTAGFLTFFFASAAPAAIAKKSLSEYTPRQLTGVSAVAMLTLIAMSAVQIPEYFHLGIFTATIISLVLASVMGISGGMAFAVLANVSLTLYDAELAIQTGILVTAIFFAGLFKPVGKYAQSIVFAGVTTCCMLAFGPEVIRLQGFLSSMAGCLLFLAVPSVVASKLQIYPQTEKAPPKTVKQRLSARLDFNARTLLDIHKSVSAVSKKLNQLSEADIFTVYKKTTGKVCKNCGLNKFCWETAYDETISSLNEITGILKTDGVLTHENAPYHYKQKCCKLDNFLDILNHQYRDFILSDTANRMIREARYTIIEQFEGISDMLAELSREVNEIGDFDDESSDRIVEFFFEQGYPSAEAYAYTDKFGHMRIEVYFDQALQTDPKILSAHISDRLYREFDIPSCVTVENEGYNRTRLSFFERANYSIDFHAGQVSAVQNNLCGDSYEFFIDSKGYAHMILSDGMGNGPRAAVDSIMACSLLLRLIKSGFGYDAALKLINTSIISKSHDESFATLDAACIDLYTGNLEILKAGGAASLIYKNGAFMRIEGSGLPIGILQGVSFDRRKMRVNSGDIVIMVSDGVLSTGIDWLEAEIELHKDKSAAELSEILCSGAERRRIEGRSDDMTVMVMKIENGV